MDILLRVKLYALLHFKAGALKSPSANSKDPDKPVLAPDERSIQINIFLIFTTKTYIVVLIRSSSVRQK